MRSDQPAGKLERRFIRQVEDAGLLTADIALAGVQVTTVQLGQPLGGDLSKPWVKRQRPVAQIVGERPVRFSQCFLNHIGGVQAGGQPAVEVKADHLAEALAVPAQELLAGIVVAMAHAVEELISVGGELGQLEYSWSPGTQKGRSLRVTVPKREKGYRKIDVTPSRRRDDGCDPSYVGATSQVNCRTRPLPRWD